jgi:hypothetical protein
MPPGKESWCQVQNKVEGVMMMMMMMMMMMTMMPHLLDVEVLLEVALDLLLAQVGVAVWVEEALLRHLTKGNHRQLTRNGW